MFYLEYFKFELAFLVKIIQRKEILQGDTKELKFVDEENEEMKDG